MSSESHKNHWLKNQKFSERHQAHNPDDERDQAEFAAFMAKSTAVRTAKELLSQATPEEQEGIAQETASIRTNMPNMRPNHEIESEIHWRGMWGWFITVYMADKVVAGEKTGKELKGGELWAASIVREHSTAFISLRVRLSGTNQTNPLKLAPGQQVDQKIKRGTLKNWIYEWQCCIRKFVINPEVPDQKFPGSTLLANGLREELNNAYKFLSQHHKLDSEPFVTEWAGAAEVGRVGLWILFVGKFKNEYRRLQLWLAFLVLLYTGLRVSSLVGRDSDDHRAGMLILLKHVAIFKENGAYRVTIKTVFSKGNADSTAQRATWTFMSVSEEKNALFDMPSVLLDILIARGALQDFKEIINFPAGEIVIKAEVGDEPLFESVRTSTHPEPRPWPCKALSNAIVKAFRMVGIFTCSAHSMRRAFAERMAQAKLHSDQTQSALMMHKDGQSTRTKHYLRLFPKLPINALALGESQQLLSALDAEKIKSMKDMQDASIAESPAAKAIALDVLALQSVGISLTESGADERLTNELLDSVSGASAIDAAFLVKQADTLQGMDSISKRPISADGLAKIKSMTREATDKVKRAWESLLDTLPVNVRAELPEATLAPVEDFEDFRLDRVTALKRVISATGPDADWQAHGWTLAESALRKAQKTRQVKHSTSRQAVKRSETEAWILSMKAETERLRYRAGALALDQSGGMPVLEPRKIRTVFEKDGQTYVFEQDEPDGVQMARVEEAELRAQRTDRLLAPRKMRRPPANEDSEDEDDTDEEDEDEEDDVTPGRAADELDEEVDAALVEFDSGDHIASFDGNISLVGSSGDGASINGGIAKVLNERMVVLAIRDGSGREEVWVTKTCPLCENDVDLKDKVYTRRSDLEVHQHSHVKARDLQSLMKGETPGLLCCPSCHRSFPSIHQIEVHLRKDCFFADDYRSLVESKEKTLTAPQLREMSEEDRVKLHDEYLVWLNFLKLAVIEGGKDGIIYRRLLQEGRRIKFKSPSDLMA